MEQVLGFELAVGGFLSAVPFLFQMIFVFFTGWLADFLLMRKVLTTTQVRKYFNNSALLIQAALLMAASFILDPIAVVVCVALAVGASALAMPGFLSNSLDIAPQFSSIVLGISNTFATIPGFASPSLTAVIIPNPNEPTAGLIIIIYYLKKVKNLILEEYRIVFMITCVIFVLGAIVYGLFATAEIQPWAVAKPVEYPEPIEVQYHYGSGKSKPESSKL
jgi:ACS family sodium-dependent inorganic phosphate cotransporter